MKTIELYSMIHDNGEWANGVKNGDVHCDYLSAARVESKKRDLESLGMSDRFRFESMGFFTAHTVPCVVNSMTQSDIDAGGDCESFETFKTIYSPASI
jgi:hypothetical protein